MLRHNAKVIIVETAIIKIFRQYREKSPGANLSFICQLNDILLDHITRQV